MLLELGIENFAIIDECHVKLDSRLVALTGETGAGKSIIVDALSACLGGRVGPEVVRQGAEQARVEALFSIDQSADLLAILKDSNLEEPDGTLILCREIQRGGRSVARVNGRAVPISMLAPIGRLLVDVHGQSEHMSLLRHDRQLDMLDHYGRLDVLRKTFAAAAQELIEKRKQLTQLKDFSLSSAQKIDLLRFQVEEIERSSLSSQEQEELMAERTRLVNAEKLVSLANSAFLRLAGEAEEIGAVQQLVEARRSLDAIRKIDPTLESNVRSIEDLRYQAEDLAASLREYRDSVEFDTRRLEEVESRLEEISRMERKYGGNIEEILRSHAQLRAELEAIDSSDRDLAQLEAAVGESDQRASALAQELSVGRKDVAASFAMEVSKRLELLGLGSARFEIKLSQSVAEEGLSLQEDGVLHRCSFTSTGVDNIQFLVSFNAGEPPKPIEKVASGGETARFMLAVKAVLADSDDVPTLVFDEVDTGVGGRSGSIVGGMLHELAESHQVLAITHLPQIAAHASQHLQVMKIDGAKTTEVRLQNLDRNGRLRELAEMLSGSSPSEVALKSAEELLAGV